MANSYQLSNKAVEDLSAIWNHTCDNWSEKQADKYFFMILETCQDIADGKIAARQYGEVHEEIYGTKAGQHLIFFRRPVNNSIEVLRILHNRMDLKNRLII